MRKKQLKGKIDSLNFNSQDLEIIFDNEDYTIETVKSRWIFEPKRWREAFGKALTKNIIEAKILHTHKGLELPIKRFAVSPKSQTIEFAGLNGYNERSEILKELLKDLFEQLNGCYVSRVDIAIDFKGKIPNRVIKALCKDREPFTYANTTYYKAKSENKTNPRLNIKRYNKKIKDNLEYELERLEFVFQGGYFNKTYLEELEGSFQKMEKTIKRFAGVDVKIDPF